MNDNLWISLVVATFAVYRVSRMVALEEGPFEIFLNARGWAYNKFEQVWVRRGLTCPLCISFYVALPAAVIIYFFNHLEWYAILWLWFGLSGSASFLYKLEQS